jgi:non-ribosomal peptide synthetase component F
VQEVLDHERAVGFDVTKPPLLRFVLVRLADRYRLVLTNHHILWDGWSLPLLLEELFALYAAGGDDTGLPPVVPFKGYLSWLAQWDRPAAEAAWADALAGLQHPTIVAPHTPARRDGIIVPGSVQADLPEQLTASLTDVARRLRVTLSTVVRVAWALCLGRVTGRDDVVFGATVSGRPPQVPDVEKMIGLFANTLPVRVRMRDDETLAGLLTRLQSEQTDLLPHHHMTLSQVQRLAGRGPLFDTLIVFENYPLGEMTARETEARSGLRITGAEARAAAHYPLALAVAPRTRLHMRLDYQPDLFDHAAAQQMVDRLVRVLEAVAADPDQPAASVEVLDPVERRAILEDWNDTARDVAPGTLPQLVQAQVAATPDAVAVVFGEVRLTYGELNAAANRLARLLVGRGVGPESVVALALPRSADLVVAILAVMKAGGAYLPVDPGYPAQRIAYMLSDAAPVCVLTTDEVADTLPASQFLQVLTIDDPAFGAELAGLADSDLGDADRRAVLLPTHPAYVIYTSGSTGRPKGVVVANTGVRALAGAQIQRLGVEPGSRVLQFASPSFDAAFSEMMMAL